MTEEESVNPDKNDDSGEEQEESELQEAPIVFDPSQQEIFEGTNNIEYIQKKLADKVPEQLIAFLEKYNDEQAEITKIREENRHQEVITRENNKVKLQLSIIASAFSIVISCLIYAGVTEDSALTDKIITALLAAGTGAGGVTLFKKQDNTKPPKEK